MRSATLATAGAILLSSSALTWALTPTDPRYSQQWAPQTMGAPTAWDTTQGSQSVIVAVLDTGLNLGHEDVPSHVRTDLAWDFINNDSDPTDDNGHGTHLALSVAAP